jgi:hypothetical protein
MAFAQGTPDSWDSAARRIHDPPVLGSSCSCRPCWSEGRIRVQTSHGTVHNVYVRRSRVRHASARRVLEDLVTAARTCARLGVLTDTGVAYIEKRYDHSPVSTFAQAPRLPAHATALGKALLAFSFPSGRQAWHDRRSRGALPAEADLVVRHLLLPGLPAQHDLAGGFALSDRA